MVEYKYLAHIQAIVDVLQCFFLLMIVPTCDLLKTFLKVYQNSIVLLLQSFSIKQNRVIFLKLNLSQLILHKSLPSPN